MKHGPYLTLSKQVLVPVLVLLYNVLKVFFISFVNKSVKRGYSVLLCVVDRWSNEAKQEEVPIDSSDRISAVCDRSAAHSFSTCLGKFEAERVIFGEWSDQTHQKS